MSDNGRTEGRVNRTEVWNPSQSSSLATQSYSYTEFQLIDRVCAALSDDAAALMLEIAEGMVGAGMDESGGAARARRALLTRLDSFKLERRTANIEQGAKRLWTD